GITAMVGSLPVIFADILRQRIRVSQEPFCRKAGGPGRFAYCSLPRSGQYVRHDEGTGRIASGERDGDSHAPQAQRHGRRPERSLPPRLRRRPAGHPARRDPRQRLTVPPLAARRASMRAPMTLSTLRGKTLFITGASRGIGKAIGLRAARDGANIVTAAKTAEPHPKLAGTIYTAAEEIEKAGGKAL